MTRHGTVQGLDRPRGRTVHSVLLRLVVAAAAALLAALLLGTLARVGMRLVVVAAGRPGEFSPTETLSILLMFAVVMLPGAVLAALTRRRGRSLLLVAGALFLCVPATGIAGQELGPPALVPAGAWLATAGVYAAILALPLLTLRLVDRGLLVPWLADRGVAEGQRA